jgi:predicted Ser/Thr protein kinase
MPGLRGVKIDPKDLRWIRPIGQGSCGEVYEAMWRGTRVAVKKARHARFEQRFGTVAVSLRLC